MKIYLAWGAAGVAAVAAGIGLAEFATSGDDPAILACETALVSQLKSPKSYERVKATIKGSDVSISYDAVNGFNAPIRGEKNCTFEINSDGKFSLAVPDTAGALEELTKEMNGLNKSTLTPAIVQQYQTRVDELTKQGMEQILIAIQEAASLKDKDWYPINPTKTELKSAP